MTFLFHLDEYNLLKDVTTDDRRRYDCLEIRPIAVADRGALLEDDQVSKTICTRSEAKRVTLN